MALRIRIEHGQDAGRTWRLGPAGTYRFGRNPASSVQVLDMKVSKDHFEIAFADGVDATIRDLESSHGTLLNGQPVTLAAKPLVPGDEIRVGLTVLRVLSDGPADGEAEAKGPAPAANGVGAAPAAAQGAPIAGAGAAPGSGDTTARRSTAGSATGATPQAGLSSSGSLSASGVAGGNTGRRSAPLPPDALVGQTLAGYKILEKVGAGGMGSVYRAEQLSLHREVALKVLAEKLVSDSAFVDQFQNEARAAGALNHPNVVQVYDVGHADGRHFFSMEFIHGGSVEGRIPRGGRGGVDWKEALGWFLDAANALVFAERKGILHRDIKPDNFMIGQDGSVKLCDLGLAKKSESVDLLAQGIIGTPHFISPEAIRRRTDVDKRSDLYSLGCTFYKVLTGKNPYPLGTVKEILLAHLNAPVPKVSALVSDVPKELDEIVSKLMQKEPADRFQDAEELWKALDKVRLQFGMEEHGLNPGRAKKVAIFVSLAALVVVGVALNFALKPREKEIVFKPGEQGMTDTRSAEEVERLNAKLAYGDLENEQLRVSQANDFGKEAVWEEMAKKWDRFAGAHEKVVPETAADARERAKSIRASVADFKAEAAKYAALVLACCTAVGQAHSEVIAKVAELRSAGKLVEAERAVNDALKKIRAEFKRVDAKLRPLYDKNDAPKIEADLTRLAADLVGDVTHAFDAAKAKAVAALDLNTPEGLETALTTYRDWIRDHPAPDPAEREGSKVAQKLAEYAVAVQGAIEHLENQRKLARERDLREDQASYYAWLRATYLPRPEGGGRGGWYAEFDAAAVRSDAHDRGAKARTKEFKELFQRREAEAERAGRLTGTLATAFAQKPWKDPVAGAGWKGPITEIKPESMKAGGQDRYFRVEGIPFFVDLFFDAKGQERFALSADDHEGLAVLAEAGGVAFDGASPDAARQFERAQRELERAAALDASRAERLKPRRDDVGREGNARRLFLEARESIEKADAEIGDHAKRLASGDKKERDAAPKMVADREKELSGWIQAARQKADELEQSYAGTIVRAILAEQAEKPPLKAMYAGVDVPPEPVDEAAPNAPIKTPPPPGPGSAMGDGTPAPGGATPPAGMDGDGTGAPGMEPPPVPGKDAPPPGMDAPK